MEKEDLKLRTKKFSLDIIYLYKSLPKTAEFQTIGRQLLKSGTSVGANTRSAYRGRSKKEFIAKLGVVIEEADESGFWLELLEELSINNKETLLKLRNEANELTAIFTSIVKNNK
jgi:four helix bundle protein